MRKELGRRIVQRRKRRGWTQAELARRLKVSRERLGKWERGIHEPSLDDLVVLSEVLESPLEELGLGAAVREVFSSAELEQLARLVDGMVRLLRPRLARRRGREET